MVDVIRIPHRLEQDIREAQRQQVLHRLLAEVMVDPENPVFAEGFGDRIVDFAAGAEIGAEWLFQRDPGIALGQADALQIGDGGFEQARCGREEDGQAVVFADLLRKLVIAIGRGRIHRNVSETVEEVRHRAAAIGRQVLFKRLARELAEFAGRHFRAGRRDDA